MRPDEIVRKLLEIRGISSEDGVREFLSGKPKLTHDPSLLPGVKEGAESLFLAIYAGKRVCVYGDYDVDGVCGTAMLTLFLREAARIIGGGAKITYYIPSRIEEGYGLNNSAIRAIRDGGADFIVTVDCGSVSPAEVAYAKEIGLDILITDHHDPDPELLPDCVLINPKVMRKSGENRGDGDGSDSGGGGGGGGYPFRELSGAGVAFKLCAALMTRIGGDTRALLHGMVDFVCVATIADVMPLIDENRTFVKYGLSLLQNGTRPAFAALLKTSVIDRTKLSAKDIAFGIAPRINAIGRLGNASEAVEFFLTGDENRIRDIAEHMEQCNTERRGIQDECFRECMALYEEGHDFLLLKPADSHEGVAGIVAGKVRDATGLPCAVLTESQENGEYLKGSARSGGRLDLIALLRRHDELFERLGGHAAAAGFLINKRNEEPLREALDMDMRRMLEKEPDLLETAEEAELEIEISDVGQDLADAIEGLAPFGAGNPRPALSLCVKADRIAFVRIMGQDGKHLRFVAGGIPCVFFNAGDTRFPKEGTVQMTGCPEMNEWNDKRNIQFNVTRIVVLQ